MTSTVPSLHPDDTMGKRIENKIRDLILAVAYPAWEPSHAYEKGDRVEPAVATGWTYECTAEDGSSGATAPRWPTVEGATVTDGTTAWVNVGLSLTALKVMFRGEPGFVPTRLYPFSIVFLSTEQEATGQDGYSRETGVVNLRYSGYVSCEQYFKDVETLEPDANRKADIGSYQQARELIQGCWDALTAWDATDDPVYSPDSKERTVELFIDEIRNGVMGRADNFSNRGSFNFHIYTAKTVW